MPYSCTLVLPVCPIYINASIISVLFPDAISQTLGSALTPSTERVGVFSTGGKQFFIPTLVYLAIWRGGKLFNQPTLVPYFLPDHHKYFRMPRGL
jgi:hypothetical protein